MQQLELQQWPRSRLIAYARNPRKNDHAVEQMAGVIREFGFRIPIIAKSTGDVVDGHLRLKAACHLGLETVSSSTRSYFSAQMWLPVIASINYAVTRMRFPARRMLPSST